MLTDAEVCRQVGHAFSATLGRCARCGRRHPDPRYRPTASKQAYLLEVEHWDSTPPYCDDVSGWGEDGSPWG